MTDTRTCQSCNTKRDTIFIAIVEGMILCIRCRMRREAWRHNAGLEMWWDL